MKAARILAPALLLAVFGLLAGTSMLGKSVTGDEVAHLPAGYSYVASGDFRLNPQHPPLVKALAGLPLLLLDLRPVEEIPGWAEADEWRFGRHFLTRNRAPLRRIVTLARLPMLGLGLLLGLFLFLWARELWGAPAAAVLLALWAFCPNLLAHTRFVTTDVGVACFTVAALWLLWRFARRRTIADALGCGVALGLALLAKYSGIVTLGLAALLFALVALLGRLARSRPSPTLTPCAGAPGEISHSPEETAKEKEAKRTPLAWGAATILGTCLLLVTIGFDFPHGLASYADGFGRIYADANPRWEGFLWGRYSATGFRHYYLLAQLWKTPLPTLLLFALGVGFLLLRRTGPPLLDRFFVLAPLAAFHLAGVLNQANIGIRHVLPAFPFLILAAGPGVRWLLERGWGTRLVLAGLLVWLAAGMVRVYPHFLPYFNESVGGPERGIYYLDDSNVEWGQDWWGVRAFLERQRPERVEIFAFEPLPRTAYGVEAPTPDLRDVVWPEPGVTYLMGAHYLRRSSLYDRWTGVRFEWLERYEPVATIGWSIFVYRFSIDPADHSRTDVIYLPRARWLADAEEQLLRILRANPDFDQARRLLARVVARSPGA